MHIQSSYTHTSILNIQIYTLKGFISLKTHNSLPQSHTCIHKLNKSLTFRREWSLPKTLWQEVPASCSWPITRQHLTMKVPLRKSHVPLCTFDSSNDRLCFFLPVNARNPLRSSGGDTTWGNNVRMDPAIVPRRCSFRNVWQWDFISGWPAEQNCFKFYLKTWLYKLWLCSWLTGNCIPTLILFGPFGGLTCFSSLTTNQKYGLRYFRIKSKWIL